jgi:hypothetical protein
MQDTWLAVHLLCQNPQWWSPVISPTHKVKLRGECWVKLRVVDLPALITQSTGEIFFAIIMSPSTSSALLSYWSPSSFPAFCRIHMSWVVQNTTWPNLGAFKQSQKSPYYLRPDHSNVWPSICPRVLAQGPLDGLLWNMTLGTSVEVCQECLNLVKATQQYRTLYIKT